jgi:hypothetical protein
MSATGFPILFFDEMLSGNSSFPWGTACFRISNAAACGKTIANSY